MQISQNLVSPSKYDIKCPYKMDDIKYITVHNTANDASAQNEIKYMISNDKPVSFHYAVDDKEVVQGIPEDRNAWHAGDGNGPGNRNSIAVEICYSKSGGEKFEKAQRLAAQFVASKLKQYGLGIDRVRTHQSFSGKYCPHRTLDQGWDNFLNMVKQYMDDPNAPTPVPVPSRTVLYYQANIGGKAQWLPVVSGINDDAGLAGRTIEAIWAKPSSGSVTYRVHLLNGNWLPWVTTNYNASGSHKVDDYAGIIGREIDGIQFTGNVRYRAKIYQGKWLPWVNGSSDYAGLYGKRISNFQCEI